MCVFNKEYCLEKKLEGPKYSYTEAHGNRGNTKKTNRTSNTNKTNRTRTPL